MTSEVNGPTPHTAWDNVVNDSEFFVAIAEVTSENWAQEKIMFSKIFG